MRGLHTFRLKTLDNRLKHHNKKMIQARGNILKEKTKQSLTCSLCFDHDHFAWLASSGFVECIQVELVLGTAANLVDHVNVRIRHLFAGPLSFIASIVDNVSLNWLLAFCAPFQLDRVRRWLGAYDLRRFRTVVS